MAGDASAPAPDANPTASHVAALVKRGLAAIANPAARAALERLVNAAPYSSERFWDYGQPARHVVWTIACDAQTGECLVYCPTAFGPAYSWGLLCSSCRDLGHDADWHASLWDAFVASRCGRQFAPADYEVP